MARSHKTPGIYVEEVSTFPPSVAQVETAIPAFIGYTEKAEQKGEDLENKPTRISSLFDYEQFFGTGEPEKGLLVTIKGDELSAGFGAGSKPSAHIMYYALQAYFANGGGPCYIVSVGGFGALELGGLEEGLKALSEEDEPTLIVFPEAQGLGDEANHYTLINDALKQCEDLQDRFVIADLHETGEGLLPTDLGDRVTAFRDGVTSSSVKYGAAYFPNLETVFDYLYADADVSISHEREDGGAGDHDGQKLSAVEATDGALYGRIKQALASLPVALPPSGAVAGIYARVDESRGVWKAPANESVNAISGLTFKVTDEMQDGLNVDTTAGKSINAIRAFTGRGILVWGARTLDGNSNEWRYVPVRRFFNMVEESTRKASGHFVFEPNDASTWVKVRAMIENFLLLQWRDGALAGAKPEQAFFVRVGLGETMTALDILEGRMNVEVGMAVARPAEFIILRFSQKMQEA